MEKLLPHQGRLALETPLTFLGGDSWSLRQDGVVDSRRSRNESCLAVHVSRCEYNEIIAKNVINAMGMYFSHFLIAHYHTFFLQRI